MNVPEFPHGVTLVAILASGNKTFPIPEKKPGEKWHSRLDFADGSLDLSVIPQPDGHWFAGVVWTGKGEIELHLAVRLETTFSSDSFTLIPGACYNGNEGLPVNDIPTLASGRMEVPWSECTAPVVLHLNHGGISLSGAPRCQQGWSGCVVDRNDSSLWHVAPALAARRYRHKRWDNIPRPPARLQPNEVLSTSFRVDRFPATTASDLFKRFHEHHRSVRGHRRHAQAKQSLFAAARLVGEWIFHHHSVDLGGRPCLLNAFEPSSKMKPGDKEFPRDWYQTTGWCGGPMTARGLLGLGGELAGYAVKNLDFLAAEAPGAHGLARPVFDGERWHNELGGDGAGCSIRMPADYCTWMLRAASSEEAAGRPRPLWKAAARRGLDAMCDLWERHQDFGYSWDLSQSKPDLLVRGGTTGAFALLALTEGLRAWPEDSRMERTAREAAAALAIHAQQGRSRGGPLDILQADDSESAACLAEALLRLWQLTGDASLLEPAQVAARLFASWVLPWSPPFPSGSSLEGLDICGGVLANVQNRHVGPGICTSSGRFLYDLAIATGDESWTDIYRDVLAAAANCVPVGAGEMLGLNLSSPIGWSAVAPGMLTEQINVADCLNQAGEFWPVSASWGMTSLMLAWAERPDLETDPLAERLVSTK